MSVGLDLSWLHVGRAGLTHSTSIFYKGPERRTEMLALRIND